MEKDTYAVLPLRIPRELLERIDEAVSEHAPRSHARADALRRMLTLGLEAYVAEQRTRPRPAVTLPDRATAQAARDARIKPRKWEAELRQLHKDLKTDPEIAAAMGISVENVRTRRHVLRLPANRAR